jgi:hypothetical protein
LYPFCRGGGGFDGALYPFWRGCAVYPVVVGRYPGGC